MVGDSDEQRVEWGRLFCASEADMPWIEGGPYEVAILTGECRLERSSYESSSGSEAGTR